MSGKNGLKRARIHFIAAVAVLAGCAATYDGMTEQELADDYFSCILLETSRNNEKMTEPRILAAQGNCHDFAWPYANALVSVVWSNLREEYASHGAIQILPVLSNQTIREMRDAGLIE